MIFDITDNEPDHVNDMGVKWWLEKGMTDYARKENINGTKLPNITAFIVEKEGIKTRLLMDGEDIIYGNGNLEAVAVQINILKLLKEMDE